MNPQIRKYHVITVHFGNPQNTRHLANALQQQNPPPNTIVVINHDKHSLSDLDSLNCTVIRPTNNQGYAAGINSGLGVLTARGAKAKDIVICMNNDITIKPNALPLVRKWWEENSETALVGFATDQNKNSHAHGYVNLLTGRSHLCSGKIKNTKNTLFRMNYIHGAFMSAPLGLFVDNHGMPEKYFMYWEDALFSRQVTKRKIPLKVASTTVALHHSVNTKQTPSNDKLYYLVRNGALFLEQETSLLWRGYWFVVNRLRYLYHTLKQHDKPIVAQAIRDAIHKNSGPRPTNKSAIKVAHVKKRQSVKNKYQQTTSSIGAVVVTYKTPANQLERCLRSLKQNNIQDISIINNDTKNPGFATAANNGATKLKNELLLFINPDAELIPNTIDKAKELLHNQKNLGILGLMLCDCNYQNETNCYGPPVTPLSIITRHFFSQETPTKPQSVGWVSGGAMIIKRSTWQELSGFDPQFFLYWEDIDICLRARNANWAVWIMPSIRVIHERGASMKDLAQKTLLYDQSADKYFQKHYSKPIWLFQHYSRRLYRLLSHSVD